LILILGVASASAEFSDFLHSLPAGKRIIDFVGLRPADDQRAFPAAEGYDRIAW
jgi:hypothetical protein